MLVASGCSMKTSMGTPLIIFLLVLGLILVVLMMALIINPPEALVKKVYHRDVKLNGAARQDGQTKSDE